MRHHDLRIFLEIGRDDNDRQLLFGGGKAKQHIAAHVEFDLAGGEQQAIVGLGAALQNGHIEPVFGVGAVDDRLIIAAMFGLGEPIGAERHFVQRESRARKRQHAGKAGQNDRTHVSLLQNLNGTMTLQTA